MLWRDILSLTNRRYVVEGVMDQYPILLSALPDRQREWFLAAVQAAEAGKAAGAIPNVKFQDAKQAINRAFDTATTYHEDKTGWSYGRFDYHPELHTVLGFQKKLRANDNPKLIAFINEIAPLGTLFNELKGMVTKRQPKPVEEVKPGYHPPPVSTQAQQAVVSLLDQVTQETYNALRQYIIESMRRDLATFLEGHDAAVAAGKTPPSPYDFFVRSRQRERRTADFEAARNVDTLVTHSQQDLYKPHAPWIAKPEAEVTQIIEAAATKQADDIRMAFVHKNYRKIASIIDAKGNYQSGKVVGRGINLQGLDGTLRFSFKDGSNFIVTNKVVYKISPKGTPFYQFPLTFHDVVLPNGQTMPRPSEERMNTVFAKT